MIRGESILMRPLPPENGQGAAKSEGSPPQREEVINPFVAQKVQDLDAPMTFRPVRVGKAAVGFFLSAWCLLPAFALLAWSVLHAYLGVAADVKSELLIAICVGVGSLLVAAGLAAILAKVLDSGRLVASAAFSSVLSIVLMGSAVRIVVHQPSVAAASPMTAWMMEPFQTRLANVPHSDALPSIDDARTRELTMDRLTKRMQEGIIDPEMVGKAPKKNANSSNVRLNVRKKKSVSPEGEVAEAKEGE
jgi:hypothetical protein